MLTYPSIDPVAVEIGPLSVHWYGLMYLVGFVGGWGLGYWRALKDNHPWKPEEVSDLLFYVALGLIIGARVGYMIFYYALPGQTIEGMHIWEFWKGGMSFHGGFIGVAIAMWLFARKIKKSVFYVSDFVAPLVTIGLGAGRLGNFINGELWGRPTELPWGMVFPFVDQQPRHPSQLYEFFLEGVVLFFILWFFSRKPRPLMAVSGLFMLLYGVFRFSVEFTRQPDSHIGFLAFDWLTMGQALSAPLILFGGIALVLAYRPAKPA